MKEVDALNERVEKLEAELNKLREQVSELSRLLNEERKRKKDQKRRCGKNGESWLGQAS